MNRLSFLTFKTKLKQKEEFISDIKTSKRHQQNKTNKLQMQQIQLMENCQKSIIKPLIANKIKIDLNDQETKRILWAKQISSLNNHCANQKQQKVNEIQQQQLSQQISKNIKVEKILNQKPLRERFSNLLSSQMQLPLSYDHHQLIKRMQAIDRIIDFLSTHRNVKLYYFQTIKKNIFDSSSILIDLKLIQSLIFLDPSCYNLQWAMNQKINMIDLKISLPKAKTLECRKMEMRRNIIQFLHQKQKEFLCENNLSKLDNRKWHQLFDYKNIQIPYAQLPQKPKVLQKLRRNQGFSKTNPDAFEYLQLKKVNQKNLKGRTNKSLSSSSIAGMIFSNKVPSSHISNQIFQVIKEKQKRIKQQKQKQQHSIINIDRQTMLKIFDQIFLIYTDKKVSNIFKITLIQILQSRLRIKDSVIIDQMHKLLRIDKLNYFRVVISSQKIQVIQIDKQKYKQTREILLQII